MNQTMGQRVKDRALAAVARGDLQGGKFSSTTGQQSNKASKKAENGENKIFVKNRRRGVPLGYASHVFLVFYLKKCFMLFF